MNIFLAIVVTILLGAHPCLDAAPSSNDLERTPAFAFPPVTRSGIADSLKKATKLKQLQEKMEKKLSELEEKLHHLEERLDQESRPDGDDLKQEVQRLKESIKDLQEEAEALREQSEEIRQSFEKRYISDEDAVIRISEDFDLAEGDSIHSDVVVMAGDVTIAGTLDGDLVVMGGDIELRNGATINGDVVIMGGSLERNGSVTINGEVVKMDSSMIPGGIDLHNKGKETRTEVDSLDEDKDVLDISDFDLSWKFPNPDVDFYSLTAPLQKAFFRYNRVEGVYIGVSNPHEIKWDSKPLLNGTFTVGYGFASHRWRYSVGLYFPLYFENQVFELGGEGYSFTDSKDQWIVGRDENTFTAIIAREDFMDYFGREGFSITASWYTRSEEGLGTRLHVGYRHDTYNSLSKNTEWSVFGGDKIFRPNPRINDANIISLFISAALTNVLEIDDQLEGWSLAGSVELAGGPVKGDFDYTQFILDIRRYQPLGRLANFNIRAYAGFADGTVPLQKSFQLGGVSTLPGFRYKAFEGTSALLINAELMVNSRLSSRSTGWVKKLVSIFNPILFFDAGVVDQPERIVSRSYRNGALSTANGSSFGSWYYDAGFAVGDSDGEWRIGLAWPLNGTETGARFLLRLTRPF